MKGAGGALYRCLATLRTINPDNILFGVKAGVAAAAVYYVSDQGVWRHSEHTAQLCDRICQTVSPLTDQVRNQMPYELPSLPSTDRASYLALHYWNKGVMGACEFLARVPEDVRRLTADASQSLLGGLAAATGGAEDRQQQQPQPQQQ